ncbi:hypothetical protein [Rhodoblastus sp.]|uniref:hypothetical protein n=1 Tax=Rhodoblastus sp. TaxID=1962975 RepID=UPI00262BDF19|nr:hypothetical protein [Rhodoblastus sp.]
MGAFKKILRAIFEDDGAPSLYSGLVVGLSAPDRAHGASAPAGSRRDEAGPKAQPKRRP